MKKIKSSQNLEVKTAYPGFVRADMYNVVFLVCSLPRPQNTLPLEMISMITFTQEWSRTAQVLLHGIASVYNWDQNVWPFSNSLIASGICMYHAISDTSTS